MWITVLDFIVTCEATRQILHAQGGKGDKRTGGDSGSQDDCGICMVFSFGRVGFGGFKSCSCSCKGGWLDVDGLYASGK